VKSREKINHIYTRDKFYIDSRNKLTHVYIRLA
jgi:hypothetical protein